MSVNWYILLVMETWKKAMPVTGCDIDVSLRAWESPANKLAIVLSSKVSSLGKPKSQLLCCWLASWSQSSIQISHV